MYPVTSAYMTRVRGTHRRVTAATLRDPLGSALVTLHPNRGGSVSFDARRDVRSSCSDLTLASGVDGVDLIPEFATDPTSPLTDNEVFIQSGVVLANGTTEWVPLGVFGFQEASMTEDTNGVTVTLTDLADRSRLVTRSRWVAPYTIPWGTDLATAISSALDTVWPAHPALVAQATAMIGALVTFTEGPDSDPWRDLCGLAAAHGMELYFDRLGIPTLRDLPQPASTDIVATYEDGTDAVLLSLKRSVSIAEGSYNGLVVTGESTSGAAPVRYVLWDSPTGPTTSPPERPRPAWYSSPMITTVTQAQSTCAAMLPRYLGATELLSWTQLANPAHDPWDLVHVSRPSLKADVDVLFDQVTVPFAAADAMTVVGRSRTVWTGVV